MTSLLRVRLLLFIIACTALPALVQAQSVRQKLERTASKVRFSATSGFLNSTGTLTDYTAELTVDPAAPTNARITLTVNPSSFALDGATDQQVLIFRSIIATLHQGPLRFESKEVKKVSDKSLSVRGVAYTGAQTYQISVPVRIVEISRGRSRFSGVIRSQESADGNPFSQASLNGEVQFDLVFVAAS